MLKTVELFYDGGGSVPSGALVTNRVAGRAEVSMSFSTEAGVVFSRQLSIMSEASVAAWSSATFVADRRIQLERSGDSITVGDSSFCCEGLVVPSYAASLLVAEFTAQDLSEQEFGWLDEESGVVKSGRLRREADDAVTSPLQHLDEPCQKVTLWLDNVLQNTYWLAGGCVVASDWNGARSYALPDSVVSSLYPGAFSNPNE